MFKEVETWADMLKALQQMTPEQLQQPIQSVQGHPMDDYVYELQQGICLGTVDEIGLKYTRSVKDNRRHGDEVILYTDGNPFGEDGAVAYELLPDGGDKPIYPKDHDESKDWTGPAQKLADQNVCESDNLTVAILSNRLKNDELR